MGSSCSIVNDTEHDVWITHEVNWEVAVGVTRGLVNGLALGARVLALVASDERERERGRERNRHNHHNMATGQLTHTRKAGMTRNDWVEVASVLEKSDEALAEVLQTSRRKTEEMRSAVREFQEKAELIKPGEKYTWHGSLSLTKRVHVMNDKLQFDDKGCFTGRTADSEKVYTISNHFRKLDVF